MQNSPELKSELNAFINDHRDTTSFGATIRRRYFVDKRIVKNALDENEARKFVAVIDLFRRYGAQYNFDYLMITAQAYQEFSARPVAAWWGRRGWPHADQALDRGC